MGVVCSEEKMLFITWVLVVSQLSPCSALHFCTWVHTPWALRALQPSERGVLLDPQAGERVGDGVVPHAGVIGPGDVDADTGSGHDVGGDEVVGGDLVEDRHRGR